jgi:aromatic-L-amino-acid/L-tryptophan decarboxylase
MVTPRPKSNHESSSRSKSPNIVIVSQSNFELNFATRRRLGYELINLINDYFESLPTRPVQAPVEQRSFEPLRDAMPETGVITQSAEHSGMNGNAHDGLTAFLRQAAQQMIEGGFHLGSANYFGLMNPTPTYAGVLAEALVAALNPQLATTGRSQLAIKIEAETIRWIGERFGWQQPFDGSFTSGGNEANFSALALALATHFPQTIEDGVASIGAQPMVYASAESHHSLDKSVGLLGLGRKALHRIPLNDRCSMDVTALEQAIAAGRRAGRKPFCVVATAGTTNSGIIDDIPAIADLCEREGLWLHLDGAYGAAVTFSDTYRHLVRGIERCDSVTIDPHKWLSVPFVAGVILTRRPQAMQAAFGVTTPYMPKPVEGVALDNFKVSMQWTRRMNSLKLWLTLQMHGRGAYQTLIDNQMQWAREFANWVGESEQFELATPQVLPILNLRLKHAGEGDQLAQAHVELVERVTRDGRRWISETRVAGRSAIRVMIVSYLTGTSQLKELQEALLEAIKMPLLRGAEVGSGERGR